MRAQLIETPATDGESKCLIDLQAARDNATVTLFCDILLHLTTNVREWLADDRRQHHLRRG